MQLPTLNAIDRNFHQSLRLWLGVVGVVLLSLIAVYRFVVGQTLVGWVDAGWAAGMALIVLAIRYGGARGGAGLAMALLSMSITAYKVHLLGMPGMAWVFPIVIGSFAVTTRVRAAVISALGIGYACFFGLEFKNFEAEASFFISATMVALVAYISVAHVEDLRMRLEGLASIDPLTGAGNRRAMEAWMMGGDRARCGECAIAVLDLDYFKQINDKHGHAAGDRVLVDTAALVGHLLRPNDMLFRLGGEEFVVALPAISQEDASGLLRLMLAAIPQKIRVRTTPVTASIGFAMHREGESPEDWLARADAALYRAKGLGRNRVVDADSPSELDAASFMM